MAAECKKHAEVIIPSQTKELCDVNKLLQTGMIVSLFKFTGLGFVYTFYD